MSLKPPSDPLIAIVGATGTGKSKLAVELAKRFNGEIVNGDAMQMYKGLPIITNKISEAEKQNIPHHILDQIGLEEQPWTVAAFRRAAHQTIREIRSRGRLPILVGGTHYYAKAILFNDYLLGSPEPLDGGTSEENRRHEFPILEAPTSEILAKLREVDPKMANRWHPLDRRKILRSLEIWLQTGKTASQTYKEQSQQRLNSRASSTTSDMATTQSSSYSFLVFWLRAQEDILRARLDMRVDSMIASGLIQEAQETVAHSQELSTKGITIDKTKGIWISIGYKEMEPYILALRDQSGTQTELDQLQNSCITATKTATRQYAHRQERWIRAHLSDALTECDAMDTLYPLDCTDVGEWDLRVREPAIQVTGKFLAGHSRPSPESMSDMAHETISAIKAEIKNSTARECRYCELCEKTLMTEKEWTGHLKSNTHKKAQSGKKRWDAFVAWQAQQAQKAQKEAQSTPESDKATLQA